MQGSCNGKHLRFVGQGKFKSAESRGSPQKPCVSGPQSYASGGLRELNSAVIEVHTVKTFPITVGNCGEGDRRITVRYQTHRGRLMCPINPSAGLWKCRI
ncbi:hypothetical protein SKAU_G00381660 [Synaphobranchus kaupii]|uniref:Uncharacterized protein n=1 Tax=Synaphobranchus kaupii TaxID=118154 RepID=A0A9Q1IER8_SYNKA|nr:hypothetical protein SKAU_G00381660 [Synaphobranchus kaupii]